MTERLRLQEWLLLVLANAIMLGGFALLSEVRYHHVLLGQLTYPIVFALSTFLFSVGLSVLQPAADQFIWPVVSLLAGMGILVVSRLDAGLGHRQVVWTILGEALALLALSVPRDLTVLRRYKYTIAFAGLFLIILTIVAGTDINGSGYKRWIGFHGIYFQPVEILKPMIAVFFAAYLDEKRELLSAARLQIGPIRLPPFQYLAPLVAVWGLSLLLLVKQNDLGSALLFLGIFLAMIYVGTARAVYPIGGFVMFVVGAFLAFHLFPHVRDRTEIWLDPWVHAAGSGFQLIQGLIALSTGGIGGQGLGQGQPYLVPVVTTDFILAAIGEELGLLGVVALLALLLFVVFRGLAIAIASTNNFHKLLAAGLVAIVGIQTIVIVGGTTRLMPLTGVPLPYLSYGGSAALANYVIAGLLLRISGARA
ncbi:MAG TPA: FtsW/RodA/SpoVE family cell cycle protein [Chloroflexota bacterium]|nr:FtsW/RodA/SpoVE family cell cycle protein [Chloroflexota bacterium]